MPGSDSVARVGAEVLQQRLAPLPRVRLSGGIARVEIDEGSE